MKIKNSKPLWFLFFLISCVEPYQPPTINGGVQMLVVDGFLNASDSSCIVLLSRSQDLTSTNAPPKETNAIVSLEEEDGVTYSLFEISPGKYSITGVLAKPLKKYRLNITIENGEHYLSDFVELKTSPPVDSITWRPTEDGLQLYVNTHDPDNQSKFYQWKFVETWEYTSVFHSTWKFNPVDSIAVLRTDDLTTCWKTSSSTNIFIGSSTKLSEDIISEFPINIIPKFSEKYLIRYSILVQQNTLTEEAYNYYQQLQKNTESLGTLFDPLPSQLVSNIRNINNESEPVLGYFNTGTVTEKRIFIQSNQLPPGYAFVHSGGCEEKYVELKFLKYFGDISTSNELTSAVYVGGGILVGYNYTQRNCMDCREAGGTLQKPDFW